MWPIGDAPAKEFCSEDKRLVVLASFDAEALFGDEELARITRFAAELCGAGSAAVSLVHAESQRFVASDGMTETETPRSTSFCAHTMMGTEMLEVLDATDDERFADFELVRGDAQVRYYAGAPIVSVEGAPLGALCVTDNKARTKPLTDFQREGMIVLAEAVKRRLYGHRQASSASSAIKATSDRLQFVLNSMPDIAWSAGPGPRFDYFNARFAEVTGQPSPQSIKDWEDVFHPDDFGPSAEKFKQSVLTASAFEDELRLRKADGSYIYVLSRAVPSSDDPATARWFGTLTDIDETYRISQERELLAGELAHRIKNIFSVITGLVTLHARGDATLSAFAEILTDNIRALSRAQEFALRIDSHTEEDLKGLLSVLMAPYGIPGSDAVSIAGENIAVGVRSATPLALVFHELATNSAKYGALSVEAGHVSINVSGDGEHVQIRWEESGGPPAMAPTGTGFGSRLMKMAIEHQLGGTLAQDWRSTGLVAEICIPASRLGQ